MPYFSVIGLVAILAIAWGLSFHRTKVKIRPILWGLSLQFLFAVIVLKADIWSFIGMGGLSVLITSFILRDDTKRIGNKYIEAAIVLIGCAIFYGVIYLLKSEGFYSVSTGLKYALIGLVILLIINGFVKISQPLQRMLGVTFVLFGVSLFFYNNYHGQFIFQKATDVVIQFLALSDKGAEFIFGNLAKDEYFFTDGKFWPGFGFQFAFKVLPTIIFFGGFMSVLYYFGIMQIVIEALSKFMRWTLGTSGAETLSCSANIFVGQTEAPLLIKPFLDDMTKSELLTIMVGGFATIAGGVLAGYIAMGIPAGHLMAASVMAAPGALVIGKLLYPELEHSKTAGDVALPNIKSGSNVLEAAASGISDGLKLAANVGAMLIGFIALVAFVDFSLWKLDALIDGYMLGGAYHAYEISDLSPVTGYYDGYFPCSLQTIFGTILRPVAFLMGVPWEEAGLVGNLIGIKLSLNEFVAYGMLTNYMTTDVLSPRSITIATYALCGFANFSSIGIQIGGISAISPGRKTDLAKVGLRAMLGGAIVSMLTGTMAGLLI